MSSLYNERDGLVYVPMSLELWNQLRYEWSEPVQARVDSDESLVFRSLRKIGDAYVTDAPSVSAVPSVRTTRGPADTTEAG